MAKRIQQTLQPNSITQRFIYTKLFPKIMTELFLALRDRVGLNSTVVLNSDPTLIKDLPPQAYDLSHQKSRIAQNLGPNQIPSFLLHYCADLEKKGFAYKRLRG